VEGSTFHCRDFEAGCPSYYQPSSTTNKLPREWMSFPLCLLSDVVNTLNYIINKQPNSKWRGVVAYWLRRQTCNQQVAGSCPGRSASRMILGKLFTQTCLCSPSSINWYLCKLRSKHATEKKISDTVWWPHYGPVWLGKDFSF